MPEARIYLRPVRISDARMLLSWENDPSFWSITEHPGPFSLSDIEAFIRSSLDLSRDQQQRWMICHADDHRLIGAVDLFLSATLPSTVGIGILIGNRVERGKGFGTEALTQALVIAKNRFSMTHAECLIYPDNKVSILLFERLGFTRDGMESFRENPAWRYRLNLKESCIGAKSES
ncbi:MAG: GNAT family N-acetyltransferase [Flavobacteriales bacterium]